MLKRSFVVVLFVGLASAALIFAQPHADHSSTAQPIPIECDSSGDPCVRVYSSSDDVAKQSYKVVKFTEGEVADMLINNVRRIHDRIKDETGIDCKKGEYKYGVFRCEGGAGIATRYEQLIQALQTLYG